MMAMLVVLVVLLLCSNTVLTWLVYRASTALSHTMSHFEDTLMDVVTQINEDIQDIGEHFDAIVTELNAVNAQLAAGSPVQQQLQSTLDKLTVLREKVDAVVVPAPTPVPEPVVVTVSISPTVLTLAVGQTGQLSATVSDGSTPSFGSSDPSIATVDATGLVTAVSVGSCTISAGVQGAGASASVTVVTA